MKKLLICSDFIPETAALMPLLSSSRQYETAAVAAGAGCISAAESRRSAENAVRERNLKCPVFQGANEAMVADIDPMRKKTNPGIMEKTGITYRAGDGSGIWDQAAAVQLILFFREVREPVTVLCLGPLTDLALAVRICPDICGKIERLIIAGGCHRSTYASAEAEANIRFDPEAAAILLACDIDKLLIPLDCADRFREELKMAVPDGTLSEEVFFHRLVAAMALEDESVLKDVRPWTVYVDISGGLGYGQTVFDTRRIFEDYNCRAGFSVDAENCRAMLKDTFLLERGEA